MIGAEIYNEDGKLYYSTAQNTSANLILHTKLINQMVRSTYSDVGIGFSTVGYVDTGIPITYTCLPFMAYKSGAKCFFKLKKGGNGNWHVEHAVYPIATYDASASSVSLDSRSDLHVDSYVDLYIFSNMKKPVSTSGQYGIIFYDESGTPVFNQDSKNLNLLTVENRAPTDGWFSMPYPTACLPIMTKGVSAIDGFVTSYTVWVAIGEGNGIGKAVAWGIGALGLTDPVYNQPILHINTNEY